MQYNIFRVNNKEKLLDEMENKNYKKCAQSLTFGNFLFNLFYQNSDNSKVSWQNILDSFDVSIQINKESLKGILLVESSNEIYAVTYGMSSSLVQRYCDGDFAMNIAKRVNISKVKRKAAKFFNGSTSSLVKTLSNSNIIVLDRGESIVNLEMIPSEEENIGSNLIVGKSLKINVDAGISDFPAIIDIIKGIESRNPKRSIPLFVKLTNEELKIKIWNYLNDDFIKKISDADFNLDEMNILGSSIYFEDNFKIELCCGRRKKEIPYLTTDEVKNYIIEEHLNDIDVLEKMRVRYVSDDGGSFSKKLKETFTYNFKYETIDYVIYDGDIYYYNDDFYREIQDALKQIVFETYNHEDDKSASWYSDYLRDNNLVDIKVRRDERNGKLTTYREKAINDVLSNKYSYENLDTRMVDYNDLDFRIEIADLGRVDDVIYAVKIGSPRDFCYAIDQSNLTIDAFISRNYDKDELVEKYKGVKKIGLWLYLSEKKKIHNSNNEVDITKLNSLMFLSKLVDWSNKAISANLKPVVIINYYS